MTPLRTAAVVAALLVSGFTAERIASQDRAAAQDRVAAPPEATPTSPASLANAPAARAARPVRSTPEAPVTRRLPMGPVQGPVSSPFGLRVHPVTGRASHHDGVDLAVPTGTAVWTVAPGTVRAVGRRPGYGLVVEIDHPGGIGASGIAVRTLYAHLASVDAALRPGARVARGVAIGASGGRPGRDGVSTGAHLHFEVRDARGRALDPAQFVRLPDAPATGPRWAGAPPPTASTRPPLATPADVADPARPDSTVTEAELPELVLPDYPSLPALNPRYP